MGRALHLGQGDKRQARTRPVLCLCLAAVEEGSASKSGLQEAQSCSSSFPGGGRHCSRHLVCAPWAFRNRLTNHPGLPRTEECPGHRTLVSAKTEKAPGNLGDQVGHPVNDPDLFFKSTYFLPNNSAK